MITDNQYRYITITIVTQELTEFGALDLSLLSRAWCRRSVRHIITIIIIITYLASD